MTTTATTTKPGRTLAVLTVDRSLDLLLDGRSTATLVIGDTVSRFNFRSGELLSGGSAGLCTNGYVTVIDWSEAGDNRYAATVEPHPLRCQTCVDGCHCTVDDGCGHDGCWGRSATNDCDGILAHAKAA